MGAIAAIAPVLSGLGTVVSAVSTISGLLGGGQQGPSAQQAPKLSAPDTAAADNLQQEEAAKLRSLKRRQASTQSLFKLDDESGGGTTGV